MRAIIERTETYQDTLSPKSLVACKLITLLVVFCILFAFSFSLSVLYSLFGLLPFHLVYLSIIIVAVISVAVTAPVLALVRIYISRTIDNKVSLLSMALAATGILISLVAGVLFSYGISGISFYSKIKLANNVTPATAVQLHNSQNYNAFQFTSNTTVLFNKYGYHQSKFGGSTIFYFYVVPLVDNADVIEHSEGNSTVTVNVWSCIVLRHKIATAEELKNEFPTFNSYGSYYYSSSYNEKYFDAIRSAHAHHKELNYTTNYVMVKFENPQEKEQFYVQVRNVGIFFSAGSYSILFVLMLLSLFFAWKQEMNKWIEGRKQKFEINAGIYEEHTDEEVPTSE